MIHTELSDGDHRDHPTITLNELWRNQGIHIIALAILAEYCNERESQHFFLVGIE